jgi:hypothetical protein
MYRCLVVLSIKNRGALSVSCTKVAALAEVEVCGYTANSLRPTYREYRAYNELWWKVFCVVLEDILNAPNYAEKIGMTTYI